MNPKLVYPVLLALILFLPGSALASSEIAELSATTNVRGAATYVDGVITVRIPTVQPKNIQIL
jgi:hypothetical protein